MRAKTAATIVWRAPSTDQDPRTAPNEASGDVELQSFFSVPCQPISSASSRVSTQSSPSNDHSHQRLSLRCAEASGCRERMSARLENLRKTGFSSCRSGTRRGVRRVHRAWMRSLGLPVAAASLRPPRSSRHQGSCSAPRQGPSFSAPSARHRASR